METGFYRRPLPEDLVPFASDEGRRLFREALAGGGLEGYFRLAEQLHTQADPAFCGLSTLVVVLNALAVDPGRIWKGPWRWYGEEMLDCCVPLDRVRERGITFGQLSCLARCNGAFVEAHRATEASVDELRADVVAASARADGPVIVASYARGALGQTGGGHFSPLGGYHAARDLALVLDVARFKYPPHWVPLPRLYEAMLPIDPDTGKSRGWLQLHRGEAVSGVRYLVSCREVTWSEAARQVLETIPRALADAAPTRVEDVVRVILASLGPLDRAVTTYPESDIPESQRPVVAELVGALRDTALHRMVASTGAADPDRDTIILYTLPDASLSTLPPDVRDALAILRAPPDAAPLLEREVRRLRIQMSLLRDLAEGG